MMIHRPMIIMDEAHNARTKLTFEVLNRIAPSCIVELTATPDNDPAPAAMSSAASPPPNSRLRP